MLRAVNSIRGYFWIIRGLGVVRVLLVIGHTELHWLAAALIVKNFFGPDV